MSPSAGALTTTDIGATAAVALSGSRTSPGDGCPITMVVGLMTVDLAGSGFPAMPTRRHGSTGCMDRDMWAGLRPAGMTAIGRTTAGPIARMREPDSNSDLVIADTAM